MKKYEVIIEETVSGSFVVEATSCENAIQIAKDKYKCGDFVNEPGDIEETNFIIFDENGDISIEETL